MSEPTPPTEYRWDDGFLVALERQLVAAERRMVAGRREREPQAGRRALRARRGRWGRPLLVAALLLVAATGAAFAARALVGAPAPPLFPWVSRAPLGRVLAQRTRLLSLRAHDPAGGLPWGMRLIYTRRAGKYAHGQSALRACVQIGRVLDGRLGVLGQDGAFQNDHLFHELPVDPQNCGGLSGGHPGPMGGGADIHAASAYQGLDGCTVEPSHPNTETHYVERELAIARYEGDAETLRDARHDLATMRRWRSRLQRQSLCPPADVRRVLYGFAGPHARSVTVGAGRARRTVAVSASDERAYLVVLAGAAARARIGPPLPPAPVGAPPVAAAPPARLARLAVHPSVGSPHDSFVLSFAAIAGGGGYAYFLKAPRGGACQRLAQDAEGGWGVLLGGPALRRGARVVKVLRGGTRGLCPGRYLIYVAFSDPFVQPLPNWPFGLGVFRVEGRR
jgi:hypothetical protein